MIDHITLLATETWHLIQMYWPALVAIFGSGLGVSILTELVKRKIISRREIDLANKAIAGILSGLAALVTLAQYVITTGHDFPLFLGQHTAMVVAVAYSIYHFGGSSAYKAIATSLAKWNAIASQYNAAKTPVAANPAAPINDPANPQNLLL